METKTTETTVQIPLFSFASKRGVLMERNLVRLGNCKTLQGDSLSFVHSCSNSFLFLQGVYAGTERTLRRTKEKYEPQGIFHSFTLYSGCRNIKIDFRAETYSR